MCHGYNDGPMFGLRKLHLLTGILTITIFLVTGQIMSHHQPAMRMLSDSQRLLFRSRHLYILASGLVNLMIGLYLQTWNGWRAAMQRFGSGLLILSPIFLVLAFRHDPGHDLQSHLWHSAVGLFALFGGCMLHLIGSLGRGVVSSSLGR